MLRKYVIYNTRDVTWVEESYGLGYQAGLRSDRYQHNPYDDPERNLAWQKGYREGQTKFKLRSNYRKGELRNKSFERPAQRDADLKRYAVLVHNGYGLEYKTEVEAKNVMEARKKWLLRARPYETKFVVQEIRDRTKDPTKDFKSERGWIAKVYSSTGSVVAQSPAFLSEKLANRWMQERIEKAIKMGYRVTGKVQPGFFDPWQVAQSA